MEYCRRCKKEVETEALPTPGPAYKKIICKECGSWIKWMPKPKNQSKRTKGSKYTPENLDIFYCQVCLRTRLRLGINETLEIHHIIEIAEGGKDIPENIMVLCTACHRLVHWIRTYLNKHFRSVK